LSQNGHVIKMRTKVLAEEEWAEDVFTRRLTDDTLTFANLYVKLSATLCEKVSKGGIENFSTAQTTPSTYRSSIPFGVHYGAKYASTSRPNKSSPSCGINCVAATPTPGSTIRLVVDTVRPDVPLLIGLEILTDRFHLSLPRIRHV
jgi:hypothetical protein